MGPENTVSGVKGETVCRPATWTDVAQFFLINYGLHALSVLTVPGGGSLFSIIVGLSGVLLPFSGIVAALDAIRICAIAQPNDLQVAAKSRALCMVVKKGQVIGEDISPNFINIHGQHPPVSFTPPHIKDDENGEPIDHYHLVRLPKNFIAYPLKREIQDTGPCKLKLSYNYSFLKSIAAIAQVIYGCFELYGARGHQLEKFGYAAYSLTVIPYIIMSLINLAAAICRPHYTSMFIVLCRNTQENTKVKAASVAEEPENEVGTILVAEKQESEAETHSVDEFRQRDLASVDLSDCQELLPDATDSWYKKVEAQISGAVGEAYELPINKSMKYEKRGSYYRMLPWLVTILGVCLVIAPYLVIWGLTKFSVKESSKTQRAWLMAWLVISQVVGLFHGWTRVDDTPSTEFPQQDEVVGSILVICCGSVPAIGGFVVVAKMILESQVCTVI